jgi:hypothetical protein
MKAKVYNASYLFEDDVLDFDIPVEIHVTRFSNNQRTINPIEHKTFPNHKIHFSNPDAYKVYINCNEPITSPNRELTDVVIENQHQYDLILTTDDEIINQCSNSVMFPYGTTWLNKGKINHTDGLGEFDDSLNEIVSDKSFETSFLCSIINRNLKGYNMRKELWSNKEKITTPINFYSTTKNIICSERILPEDDKKYLFYSQFHVAIESSSIGNYFTEKLIDALITKTVPIYWGCPNISDFFDIRGMFVINSVSDIIDVCNSLNENTYNDMLPYIETNFNKSKEYAKSFAKRVRNKIRNKIRNTI